ncbi:MAG: response regulator [Elusimicrobiota bacterium]
MEDKIFVIAVDDDDVILDMYKGGLVNYDVMVFDEPKKAREYLFAGNRKPDIILMDIMMPSVDGITLIREIHSSDKLCDIPIVAVSGLSDAATLNDAMLFGAVDYIIKPFDIVELSNRIRSIVKKYKNRKMEER